MKSLVGDVSGEPLRFRIRRTFLRRVHAHSTPPHWLPDATDVFCHGKDTQPPVLFETAHFYAVPDKFPITPGHILLIPKHHLPCWAALSPSMYGEFKEAQNVLKTFIRSAYGKEPMLWENGGAWQSVHHAHLHFIPMPSSVRKLPPPYVATPVRSWRDVRRCFFSGEYYQYAEYRGDKRVFPAGSPDLYSLSLLKVKALKISIAANGKSWVRTTSPTDIAETLSRWKAWSHEHGLPKGFSQGTPSSVCLTHTMRITEPML
ncbi:MAG: HIT family protein [Candidatus Dormibacteria bacterium]